MHAGSQNLGPVHGFPKKVTGDDMKKLLILLFHWCRSAGSMASEGDAVYPAATYGVLASSRQNK
jgi:hypothetical protein